jgi:hypothetical protein
MFDMLKGVGIGFCIGIVACIAAGIGILISLKVLFLFGRFLNLL